MSDEKTFTQKELDAAIGQTEALMINSAQTRAIVAQRGSLSGAGYDNADTLHNVYRDYGYPDSLTFNNYMNMYSRFGIAKRVVEIYPDVCWITPPNITESSDQFKRELDLIIERLNMWQRLKGLDTRQRVGQYAGFFMRVKDNAKPSDELKKLSAGNSLIDMMPLYESQLKPLTYEKNVQSERYGQPLTYQFKPRAEGGRNPDTTDTVTIHHSRVIIAAEGADNGGIYGVPVLQSIYNSLMDARKIIGAGGEGFYKNAAQSVVFELTDASSASQNALLLEKFNDNFDDWMRNRGLRGMWTPGLKPTVLQSDLANPKEFLAAALSDIAAGSSVASTVISGMQTGRLASTEDSKSVLSTGQSRRGNWLTELVRNTIDWMITYGVLPKSEYTVEWDDLLALSDTEKLTNVGLMADANQKQFSSGGQPVYSAGEMRDKSDYEPDVDPDLADDEGDQDVKDDDEIIEE